MFRVESSNPATQPHSGSMATSAHASAPETASSIGVTLQPQAPANQPGSTYTYTNTGTIIGYNDTPSDELNSSGNYSGGDGFDVDTGKSLYNAGTIAGGSGGGGYARSDSGGIGVNIQGGTVLNTGVISGGAGGNQIYSYFYDRYASQGGGGNGGVGVYLNGGTLTTSGTIAGGIAGAGTDVQSGHGFTYTHPGQAGAAVQFGTAAATLVVEAGAVFQGAVLANVLADDTLVLASGSSGTFGSFTGFTNVDEQAATTWTAGDLVTRNLVVEGALAITGTLDVSGSLIGSVTLETGATLIKHAGARLDLATQVAFSGNGTLVLASGPDAGTAGNLSTTALGYSSIEVAAGSDWTLQGTNQVAAGTELSVAGTLHIPQDLIVLGTLSVSGTLTEASGHITLAAGSTLIDDAGAHIDFAGLDDQGQAALVLQGNSGSLSGLGTVLSGFTSITEAAGSSWTINGGNAIAAGTTFNESGLLNIGGRLAVLGALDVSGTLSVTGTLLGDVTFEQGATLIDNPGSAIRFADTTEAGDNTLVLAASATTGTLSGLGAGVGNFSTIMETAGTWQLDGRNAIASGTTFIGGGNIDLDGRLTNAGLIAGVNGGSGGMGSVGIDVSGGTLDNNANIAGGIGNNAISHSYYNITFGGPGFDGGTGVSLDGTTLINAGAIAGGAGGQEATYYYEQFTGRYPDGNGGAGVYVTGGSRIVNTGTISGGAPGGSGGEAGIGVVLNGGTLITSGTISGSQAVVFGASASTLVIDPGAIFNGQVAANSDAQDVLLLTGAGGNLSGLGQQFNGFTTVAETPDASWTLSGSSTLASGADLIVRDNATLTLTGSMSGGDEIRLLPGATLTADAGLSATTLRFANGGNETVILASTAPVTATLSGFRPGDTIDLASTITKASYMGGTLTLLDGSTTVESLTLAGSYFTAEFALTSDHHGGTDLTILAHVKDSTLPRADASPAATSWLLESPISMFLSLHAHLY